MHTCAYVYGGELLMKMALIDGIVIVVCHIYAYVCVCMEGSYY